MHGTFLSYVPVGDRSICSRRTPTFSAARNDLHKLGAIYSLPFFAQNFSMEGTFNTFVVYIGLTLYWISGAICMLLRSQISVLDELLTYGRLGRLANPSMNSLLRSYTLKDSTVWTTLYLFGFLFSVLTSYTVSKYNPALETPLPLTLFQVQTARRLFDCLAIHRFSTVRQMPAHFLLMGLTYYVAAPLSFSLPLGSTFFEITPSMRTIIVSYHTSHNGLSNETDRDEGTVETDA